MRSKAEILEKMELLNSKGTNWPQGAAGFKLLREYQSSDTPSEPKDLSARLETLVRENWELVLEGADDLSQSVAQVEVQTIIWLMGNDDLLDGLSRIPITKTFVSDRLETICKHYGITIPYKSEEE